MTPRSVKLFKSPRQSRGFPFSMKSPVEEFVVRRPHEDKIEAIGWSQRSSICLTTFVFEVR
jgi:hypothetical protein